MSLESEFVPYEQALALKELGFDEFCLKSYGDDGLLNQNDHSLYLSAPLYQQVFRWFREKYGYGVSIKKKRFEIEKLEIYEESNPDYYFTDFPFDSYEESELECLKKLIEIVKTK
jgi:hypothetical protein